MDNFKNLLSFRYDNFYIIDETLAIVLLNNKWGLVNNFNQVIVPIKYSTITHPKPNIFVGFDGFYYGAFDRTGNILIPFKYKTYHMVFNALKKKY